MVELVRDHSQQHRQTQRRDPEGEVLRLEEEFEGGKVVDEVIVRDACRNGQSEGTQ